MRLGVNFCHDVRQPIGFNRDALLALRPPVVRFAVTADHVGNLMKWVDHAEAEQLQVLWTIPESLSLPTARTIARIIGTHALEVTAGVEIGFAPWAFNRTPAEFGPWAVQTADALAWSSRGAAFSRERPALLGLGFDGSREASAWLDAFMGRRRESWQFPIAAFRYFHGAAVSATSPGRRFRRFLFRSTQARLMDRWQLPLAFTCVGWQVGQPIVGAGSMLFEAIRSGIAGEPYPKVVTAEVRRRWLLEAYEHAERLDALLFVLEPELLPPSEGLNRWPLYDGRSGRADTVWHKLQWRAAHGHNLTLETGA